MRSIETNNLKPHPLNAELYQEEAVPNDFLKSVEKMGVLNPLLILEDGTILSGHRRYLAAKVLGLTRVPVRVCSLEDPLDIAEAIIESNRQREKTYSQMMREGEMLAKIEATRARERQLSGLKQGDITPVPQNFVGRGEAIDRVAEKVGIGSGEQYRKGKKVWDAAQEGNEIAAEQVRKLDADEITIHKALRILQQEQQRQEAQRTLENILQGVPMETGYRAIVIDPPWPKQKILRDVRPKQDVWDYPTMTVEEIAKLPIADLADGNGCHIYLWFTHKHLPDALQLFQEWNVKYECQMTWVKNVGFTPFSWMYSTEHVLFGRIGSLPVQKKGLRLDFRGKVREHSRKPDEFYERVLQASPAPRIELFSRETREGFDQWGKEKDKFNEK